MRPNAAFFAAALLTASPAFAWDVEAKVSPVDGVKTVVATVASTERLPNDAGALEPARLIVRCADGELAAYVAWPRFVALRHAEAAWRIDERPPAAEFWDVSSDGYGAGFFRSRYSGKLIAALSGAGKLAIRIKPAGGVSQEAVFDLAGSTEAVGRAVAACRRG